MILKQSVYAGSRNFLGECVLLLLSLDSKGFGGSGTSQWFDLKIIGFSFELFLDFL